MRIVIDTNVLISAIFWTGKPKQLLNHVRRQWVPLLGRVAILEQSHTSSTDLSRSPREIQAIFVPKAVGDLAQAT